MTKRPEQTELLPGDRAWVSLKGMEITASYADGDNETITFGQTDSQGMSFKQNGTYTWVNEETLPCTGKHGRLPDLCRI